MSASAIASQIQYLDAFANKKQRQLHQGEDAGSSAALKPDFNIGKPSLEDPFQRDDPFYVREACYNANNGSSDKHDQDVVDVKSVYSTPVGKSQSTAAEDESADTPTPHHNAKAALDYDPAANKGHGRSPSKEFDDYEKIVQVIHDHITRELPALPPRLPRQQREPQPVEGQSKGEGPERREEETQQPTASDEAEASGGQGEEPATEEKTVAREPEDESVGEEEKDVGDDTVIFTPRVESLEAEMGKAGETKPVDGCDADQTAAGSRVQ